MYQFIVEKEVTIMNVYQYHIYKSREYETPELLMRGLKTTEIYALTAGLMFECRRENVFRCKYQNIPFPPSPNNPYKNAPYDEDMVQYACSNVGDPEIIHYVNCVRRWLDMPSDTPIDNGDALAGLFLMTKYIKFYPIPKSPPIRDTRLAFRSPPKEYGVYWVEAFMTDYPFLEHPMIVDIQPNKIEVQSAYALVDTHQVYTSIRQMYKQWRKEYPRHHFQVVRRK